MILGKASTVLIGRYTQSDPTGLNGGMNPYGYVKEDPLVYADPQGNKVSISIRRIRHTQYSIVGLIDVSSDVVTDKFSGFTLEPIRDKGAVPDGTYKAWIRYRSHLGKLYIPPRIQLENVGGNNTGIQVHTGNYTYDSTGCFLVGTTIMLHVYDPVRSQWGDFIRGSRVAMNQILAISTLDCTGDISVTVTGM